MNQLVPHERRCQLDIVPEFQHARSQEIDLLKGSHETIAPQVLHLVLKNGRKFVEAGPFHDGDFS